LEWPRHSTRTQWCRDDVRRLTRTRERAATNLSFRTGANRDGRGKSFTTRARHAMTSHLRGVLAGIGFLSVLLPATARGQQPTTITGRVTTEAGTPLQGASITIAAYSIGTYSNADGRYSFTVPGTRSTGQL